MIRFLLIAVGIIAIVYVVKKLLFLYGPRPSGCQRCDGHGYWRATRGEKVTCDECGGTGKAKRGE